MTLARTWAALVALSLAAAALTAVNPPRAVLVLGVLALAGMKARLILRQFLELRHSPPWSRGVDLVLTGLLTGFAVLALAG